MPDLIDFFWNYLEVTRETRSQSSPYVATTGRLWWVLADVSVVVLTKSDPSIQFASQITPSLRFLLATAGRQDERPAYMGAEALAKADRTILAGLLVSEEIY